MLTKATPTTSLTALVLTLLSVIVYQNVFVISPLKRKLLSTLTALKRTGSYGDRTTRNTGAVASVLLPDSPPPACGQAPVEAATCDPSRAREHSAICIQGPLFPATVNSIRIMLERNPGVHVVWAVAFKHKATFKDGQGKFTKVSSNFTEYQAASDALTAEFPTRFHCLLDLPSAIHGVELQSGAPRATPNVAAERHQIVCSRIRQFPCFVEHSATQGFVYNALVALLLLFGACCCGLVFAARCCCLRMTPARDVVGHYHRNLQRVSAYYGLWFAKHTLNKTWVLKLRSDFVLRKPDLMVWFCQQQSMYRLAATATRSQRARLIVNALGTTFETR